MVTTAKVHINTNQKLLVTCIAIFRARSSYARGSGCITERERWRKFMTFSDSQKEESRDAEWNVTNLYIWHLELFAPIVCLCLPATPSTVCKHLREKTVPIQPALLWQSVQVRLHRSCRLSFCLHFHPPLCACECMWMSVCVPASVCVWREREVEVCTCRHEFEKQQITNTIKRAVATSWSISREMWMFK